MRNTTDKQDAPAPKRKGMKFKGVFQNPNYHRLWLLGIGLISGVLISYLIY